MAKITVVGAGLSGMVAAINLAQQGKDVLVVEAAKGIGGAHIYHPSIHGTPIFPRQMSRYINVDITPFFHPLESSRLYVENRTYHVRPINYHVLERGARHTSVDSGLYRAAKEAGVKFQFSTQIKKIEDVPPGSIIATGFDRTIYKAFGIEFFTASGFAARIPTNDPKLKNCVYAWFGPYTRDYAYLAEANGVTFCLLFDRRSISPESFKAFRDELAFTSGIVFDEWMAFEGDLPRFTSESLRLFYRDWILAGTLAGMIDPGALFGIHGALLSGKIAAQAVTDRQGAEKEFLGFNRFFNRSLQNRVWAEKIPFYAPMFHHVLTHPRLWGHLISRLDKGIPGYARSPFKDWMGITD